MRRYLARAVRKTSILSFDKLKINGQIIVVPLKVQASRLLNAAV
jgi:hypothetical protein